MTATADLLQLSLLCSVLPVQQARTTRVHRCGFTPIQAKCAGWLHRNSSKLQQLLHEPGTLLHEYKDNIHVAEDPATAGISSTIIRKELGQVNTFLKAFYKLRLWCTSACNGLQQFCSISL